MIDLAKLHNGLYYIKGICKSRNMINNILYDDMDIQNSACIPKSIIWHFRFRHVSSEKMSTFCKDFPLIKFNKNDVCDVCHLAKQKRLPYSVSSHRASKPFKLLHMDIWGPYSAPSIHNHKYFLRIVDDFSRFTWVTLMKGKHQVQSLIQNFIALVETQYNRNVKGVRTNNGPEFALYMFYSEKGIPHQTSYVESPQ